MPSDLPHDWAGSLYKGLSLVTAGLSLPILAVTLVFGVLPIPQHFPRCCRCGFWPW
ncbi:hypothetical protein ACSBPQ_02115 [Stenotrophomonas sp. JC08]|uniref:hypothetical protein n=1 Tax=Stenotrophomonas sp. JC08 TaxID=3445779 RepID=UPI003FA1B9B4